MTVFIAVTDVIESARDWIWYRCKNVQMKI